MGDANPYREGYANPEPTPPRPAPRPLAPLTAREQARVAANRAAVHEHLPEAVPFIKQLHELGMIDGWRAVDQVEVFPVSTQGGPP